MNVHFFKDLERNIEVTRWALDSSSIHFGSAINYPPIGKGQL